MNYSFNIHTRTFINRNEIKYNTKMIIEIVKKNTSLEVLCLPKSPRFVRFEKRLKVNFLNFF